MSGSACVELLQWALPRLGLQWPSFKRVRRQVCRCIDARAKAECWLASRIGRPITEPDVVDVKLRLAGGADPARFATVVEEIVAREVEALTGAWRDAVGPELAR